LSGTSDGLSTSCGSTRSPIRTRWPSSYARSRRRQTSSSRWSARTSRCVEPPRDARQTGRPRHYRRARGPRPTQLTAGRRKLIQARPGSLGTRRWFPPGRSRRPVRIAEQPEPQPRSLLRPDELEGGTAKPPPLCRSRSRAVRPIVSAAEQREPRPARPQQSAALTSATRGRTHQVNPRDWRFGLCRSR
jgi:hypothetical protein